MWLLRSSLLVQVLLEMYALYFHDAEEEQSKVSQLIIAATEITIMFIDKSLYWALGYRTSKHCMMS